jgi:hypothetical protein
MRSTEPSPRRFGLGAFLVLGALGALMAFGSHHRRIAGGAVAGTGTAVLLLSWAAPAVTLTLRALWMRLAHAIGWVN